MLKLVLMLMFAITVFFSGVETLFTQHSTKVLSHLSNDIDNGISVSSEYDPFDNDVIVQLTFNQVNTKPPTHHVYEVLAASASLQTRFNIRAPPSSFLNS